MTVREPAPPPRSVEAEPVPEPDELEPPNDVEIEPAPSRPRAEPPAPHPLAELDDAQLEELLRTDPAALGPLSLGRPSAGALLGGMQMESSERWEVVNPRETWGTPETIEALARCIDAVHAQFPDTSVLPIGDISAREGGHLVPHVSHQSGRDVDVGYYYVTGERWYARATAANLDLPRTWAFVRAMVTETDVEVIFIDRSVQRLLRDYAAGVGEPSAWLDELFGGPEASGPPLIRHEPGHATHIHIRFYNPIAQESGRRLYPILLANKMIDPPTYFVSYKAKRGDTLIKIARKNNTTVDKLKRANGLRSNRIMAGHSYRIPRRGGVISSADPIVIPARRLPPEPQPPATVADGSADADAHRL